MAERGNNLLVGAVLGIGALATLAMMGKSRRQTDFKNKVVLITGGSRGLGLVLARSFARERAKVAICARNAEELERAKQDLQSNDAEVFSGACDVRDQNQVNNFVEDVINHFGQIDVLVNNAGVIQVGPLEDQTQKDFEDAMAVHFWGAFYMMRAAIPQMKKQGAGRIVNISSIGGKVAVPHLAPYCASKFALVGLSGAMRVELAKENIFVTTVCPGLMRTGSHVNAIFKGKNQLEFALFSTMNALPFTSVSAEKAAKKIVEATRRGDAEAIISVQAQAAAKANTLLPELVAEVSALVSQILPGAGGIETGHATGKESTSIFAPSFLTATLDKASARNNELKPGEQIA
ncbi:MAG: SDR family NAD(P)-dependent oxidoreductase [Pyrinomonadaceae bacterium]